MNFLSSLSRVLTTETLPMIKASFRKESKQANFGVVTVGLDIESALTVYYEDEQISFVNKYAETKMDNEAAYNIRTVMVDGFEYEIIVRRKYT